MPLRPDTERRVLIATALLIVILAYLIAGSGIWDHASQSLPVTR